MKPEFGLPAGEWIGALEQAIRVGNDEFEEDVGEPQQPIQSGSVVRQAPCLAQCPASGLLPVSRPVAGGPHSRCPI
jgi:hypothetical protein